MNDIPNSKFEIPNSQAAPGVLLAAPLSRRDRLFIWIALLLVIALAWAYLVHLGQQMSSSMAHDSMMAEMGMTMDMPWTATDVFFTFTMWAVMMVGMMTGTAAPMLLLFAAAHAARGQSRLAPAVVMFGLGYTIVWVAFSVGAALAQWMLHQTAMLTPAMAASNRAVWPAGSSSPPVPIS